METVPFLTDLHCSSLPQWAVCESSEVWKLKNTETRPERGEHVAAWMGSCIHSRIANQGDIAPPRDLVFDGLTPTLTVARQQIERMVEAINDAMWNEGWDVHESELEADPFTNSQAPGVRLVGRIDLVLHQNVPNRTLIVDLKTSADFSPAWLQLGGYSLLYPADMLGVLHCPRPPTILDDAVATFHYSDYPARAVAIEAFRVMRRVSDILHNGHLAIAAPGNRCRFCPHEACIVRSVGRTPTL